jgi:hypothetical protein
MQSLSRKQYLAFLLLSVLSLYLLKGEGISNWPQEVNAESGKIVIFQPEIESLSNDTIECRSAIIFEAKGDTSPLFGAIWYKSRISTDRDERTVTLLDIHVLANKFPNLEEAEVSRINKYIEKELPQWELTLSLDEILTSLKLGEQDSANSEKLKNDSPDIIFSTIPAVLILVNGEPIYGKIDNTNLEYVVNSPFFIVRDSQSNLYYLKGGNQWYRSPGFYVGWQIITDIPQNILSLENTTARNTKVADTQDDSTPHIIVRTHPAELLLSNGTPQYASVENTTLLYMTNTDNDILMDINTQEYYTLISGRWYKSKSLQSEKWTFVSPDSLPADFSRIPEDSPVSDIRASVAGTQESKEAILETKIPQTAEIDRATATVNVIYDGNPAFMRIKGTSMLYAINTEKAVLLIGGTYYCCDNGIWFTSKDPHGPWNVATSVPGEVMKIPPEYPVYNVKYVIIFDYTPEIVRVGYFPGYEYSYVYRGCVFYGTGYHYNPWYRHYYYARPVTFGFGAHYNSYFGWGFSLNAPYDEFFWIDHERRYHSHHRNLWGPAGYRHDNHRAESLGKNRGYKKEKKRIPKPDLIIAKKQSENTASNNLYSRNKKGLTRTGNKKFDPHTGNIKPDPVHTKRRVQQSKRSNDLFSDPSGLIYKHKTGGSWETQQNKSSIRLDQVPSVKKENHFPIDKELNFQEKSRERSVLRTKIFKEKKESFQYKTPESSSSQPENKKNKRFLIRSKSNKNSH